MTPEQAQKIITDGRGEYWMVSDHGIRPEIYHCRTVYYENTKWEDHPLSKTPFFADRSGADFVQDWVLEKEYKSSWEITGRNGKANMPRWLEASHIFASELEARRSVVDLLDERVRSRQQDLIEMRANLNHHLRWLTHNGHR